MSQFYHTTIRPLIEWHSTLPSGCCLASGILLYIAVQHCHVNAITLICYALIAQIAICTSLTLTSKYTQTRAGGQASNQQMSTDRLQANTLASSSTARRRTTADPISTSTDPDSHRESLTKGHRHMQSQSTYISPADASSLAESAAHRINQLIGAYIAILTGQSPVRSAIVIAILVALSIVGRFLSTANLMLACHIGAFTLPLASKHPFIRQHFEQAARLILQRITHTQAQRPSRHKAEALDNNGDSKSD